MSNMCLPRTVARLLAAGILAAPAAQAAAPIKTLFSFTQQSGWLSGGALVTGRQGLMYGTTAKGGSAGNGTVFSFDPKTRVYTVLYNFQGGADGAQPVPGLVLDKSGMLYGATAAGGASSQGTVFRLDPATGVESVLHSFGAGADGTQPPAGPVLGQDGKLYGVTASGGASNDGTIYAVNPASGNEKTVFGFNGTNGQMPVGLAIGPTGILYGTTYRGGPQAKGLIFQFDPTTETETDLFDFGPAGYYVPGSAPTVAPNGRLYGSVINDDLHGVIYGLDPATKILTQIYELPYNVYIFAPLVMGASGLIYGTTAPVTPPDFGTAFVVDPATSTLTTLYTFTAKKNGGKPSGLVFGKGNILYGATAVGGADYGGRKAPGYGTIFSMKP
jgi:uncharacterized repeat protein (TIGR03803 family)